VLLLVFTPRTIEHVRSAPWSLTALVAYLGIFPAALAYVTWTYLMSVMPVSRAVTLLYLMPPAATLIGWILNGEQPGLLALAGGMLALLGVFVVNRWGKELPVVSVESQMSNTPGRIQELVRTED
jgi:drug/metabolite transporter (DMT)-like permease